MNLHERLKEERERLGHSQTAFAALAGASKHSQINWEKGAASPNAAALAAWSDEGLDVLYVVTGQRTGVHDAAEQVLLDSYRRCGSQARQHLIQTAALLAAGLPGSAGNGGQQVNTAAGAVQILGSKNRVSNKRT